jgi:hypothetical protein
VDTGLPILGAVLSWLSETCRFSTRTASDNTPLAVIPVIGVWSAISVVAGARNHLQAKYRSVAFSFEIQA